MVSESAGGARTTARNTETHFAARLYNIFNIVLVLHKLPGPLLTAVVNRHISSRLLGSPLHRHAAASSASPATSCPEGWTRCFFCLSTLSCAYTDCASFQGEQYPATLPGCFFYSHLHDIRFHFHDERSAPVEFHSSLFTVSAAAASLDVWRTELSLNSSTLPPPVHHHGQVFIR